MPDAFSPLPPPSAPVAVDVAAARVAAARQDVGHGRATGNLYVGPGLGASLLGFLAVLADVDEADAPA